MKILTALIVSILLLAAPLSAEVDKAPEAMTGGGLEAIIKELAGEQVAINGNVIEFLYKDVVLVCIYDVRHDRMRIISAIKPYAEVTAEQKDKMLESNFHGALDARYATSNGMLYAAYIHPLSSLSKTDVLSAIYQVISLNVSFGTGYTSGLFTFGKASTAESA